MNPEGIAGGKTAGIPNLLLIGGVVLVVYFLFFRNSQSSGGVGTDTSGGGGTITTGDTTVGTGAVTVNVKQGSSGATTDTSNPNGEDNDKDDRRHKKPKRTRVPKGINPGGPIRGKHKKMPKAGSPPTRHPVNENTQEAPSGNPQPNAPVHHRRKRMHFMEGTK